MFNFVSKENKVGQIQPPSLHQGGEWADREGFGEWRWRWSQTYRVFDKFTL